MIPSIILHEVSHGYVAYRFGDDTAKRAGRLTLNPVSHVDPFGTLLLPLITAAAGFGMFGYAKPVPVSPSKLRHPRNQSLLVALAGPATNIASALMAGVALRAQRSQFVNGGVSAQALWLQVLFWLGFVNVILAIFNLIPVPPLDGSAVVERLLPRSLWPGYLRLRQYSLWVLLGVLLLAPRLFSPVLNWGIDHWFDFVFGT